jgi:predicted secreted acid phosphatase
MLKKFAAILAGPLVLAVGFASLPAQQQATKPVFSSNEAAERIPNLGTLKTQLKEYHDCTCKCGCYAHDIELQADRAIAFLQQRAARRRPHEKLALILDIDDTTLSTYPEMLDADFAYDPPVFDRWLDAAQATAIPGTVRIYKEAQRLGVSIFFITGRKEAQRAVTERNLRAQGFDNWKLLVMLPANHGSQTTGAFKAVARAQILAAGYTLALNVGDQWSDLNGTPEAEYSVKYPDPYYFIP